MAEREKYFKPIKKEIDELEEMENKIGEFNETDELRAVKKNLELESKFTTMN